MNNYIDLSTAQKALHSLEEAYRRRDIEAVIACKDFVAEAKILHKKLKNIQTESVIIDQTASVLEMAFRSQIQSRWPQFEGVSSKIESLVSCGEGIYIATTTGVTKGQIFTQKIYMCKAGVEWRVLHPVPTERPKRQRPWWYFWG